MKFKKKKSDGRIGKTTEPDSGDVDHLQFLSASVAFAFYLMYLIALHFCRRLPACGASLSSESPPKHQPSLPFVFVYSCSNTTTAFYAQIDGKYMTRSPFPP